MPVQQILNFPVRKTRSSKGKANTVQISQNETKIKQLTQPKLALKNNLNNDQENIQSQILKSRKGKSYSTSRLCKKRGCEMSELGNDDFLRSSPSKKTFSDSSDQENNSPLKITESCSRLAISENDSDVNYQLSPSVIDKITRTPLKNLNVSLRNITSNFTPEKQNVAFSPRITPSHISFSPVRRSPRKLCNVRPICNSELKNKSDCLSSDEKIIKACQLLKGSLARNYSGKLIGREEQLKQLENYFDHHLKNNVPGSLYISGAPGTGKTASVTEIVKKIQSEEQLKLKTVILNCMAMKSSKEIFSQIGQNFCKNCGRTEKEITSNIEKSITTSKIPILIILDEIDQLESTSQKVLYTLFEWPSLVNSKLILIGIANMLDLTDRILPRLQANQTCKPQLLHFSSYSRKEIVDIINERVKEADIGELQIIAPNAIEFLAGKIAAVAGDARKALDVCRRAVELYEIEFSKKSKLDVQDFCKSSLENKFQQPRVNISQVLNIFNEIYGSRVTNEIVDNANTFSLQQKVLICSLILILKNSKTKDVALGKFQEVYSRVCQRQNLPSIERGEFYNLCTLLESRGMLGLKKNKELRSSKVMLRLNQAEAEKALGDRVLLSTILEDKSCLTRSSLK